MDQRYPIVFPRFILATLLEQLMLMPCYSQFPSDELSVAIGFQRLNVAWRPPLQLRGKVVIECSEDGVGDPIIIMPVAFHVKRWEQLHSH